jgi:hypothetical protein
VTLWHFTCEHAYARIGDTGLLRPAVQLRPTRLGAWWPAWYVWLSDLGYPDRVALGLAAVKAHSCDRTAYRYRVTDETLVKAWVAARKAHPTRLRLALEGPGSRPAHWFVSTDPVPVVLDQRSRYALQSS